MTRRCDYDTKLKESERKRERCKYNERVLRFRHTFAKSCKQDARNFNNIKLIRFPQWPYGVINLQIFALYVYRARFKQLDYVLIGGREFALHNNIARIEKKKGKKNGNGMSDKISAEDNKHRVGSYK